MENSQSYESTNINSLWLANIFENLKNIENLTRLAREGCLSLLEFSNMTISQRKLEQAEIQYKNLRFIVTEFFLLLDDLTPVMDSFKLKDIRTKLQQIGKAIENKDLFIDETYSATKNAVVSRSTTKFYWDTLEFLSKLKVEVVEENADLLYVRSNKNKDEKFESKRFI